MNTDIKAIINSEFYRFLMSITKAQVNHIRKLFGCDIDVPSNLNKQMMIIGVADYILSESETWMRKLPCSEIQIIDEILQHKPLTKVEIGCWPYPLIIEDYGMVEVKRDEGNNCTVIADKYMYDAFRHGIEDTMDFIVAKDIVPYEVITRGVYGVYGAVPTELMYDILKSAEPGISAKYRYYGLQPSHLTYICESLFLNNYRVELDGVSYFVNPAIYNPEMIIREQMSRSDLDYRRYTITQLMDAGKEPPFCVTGMGLPQSKALLREYRKYIGVDFDEVLDYDFLFTLAQESPNALAHNVCQEIMFPSVEATNAFLGKVTDFSNHIPHWKLKGWSPMELLESQRRK